MSGSRDTAVALKFEHSASFVSEATVSSVSEVQSDRLAPWYRATAAFHSGRYLEDCRSLAGAACCAEDGDAVG